MMTKVDNKQLNLSAYFMLPLLKLNVNSFNESNLENVYITTQMQVVVVVNNKEECDYDYTLDPNYVLDYDDNDKTYIVYQLGDEWGDDFLYYTKGMYSKMTMFAKDEIKKNSTLINVVKGTKDVFDEAGKFVGKQEVREIDKRLRALDKDEVLRRHLETTLGIKLSPDAELWSKIKDSEYIKL